MFQRNVTFWLKIPAQRWWYPWRWVHLGLSLAGWTSFRLMSHQTWLDRLSSPSSSSFSSLANRENVVSCWSVFVFFFSTSLHFHHCLHFLFLAEYAEHCLCVDCIGSIAKVGSSTIQESCNMAEMWEIDQEVTFSAGYYAPQVQK